jgi:hypothetical protein
MKWLAACVWPGFAAGVLGGAYVVYRRLLTYSTASSLLKCGIGVKALLEVHTATSILLGPDPPSLPKLLKERAGAIIFDTITTTVVLAWLPTHVILLTTVAAKALSLVLLRITHKPGEAVVLMRQNTCMHGFMVMPELLVNTVLTLDWFCGKGHVRLAVDVGEKTMDGGMHAYYAKKYGDNMWRMFFDDNTATDAVGAGKATPDVTFGYYMHGLQHHLCHTYCTRRKERQAAASRLL